MTPTIISLVSIHRFSIESILRSFLINESAKGFKVVKDYTDCEIPGKT